MKFENEGGLNMKYWFHDIGVIDQGHILEVTLDRPAHVRIMDDTNYENFKNRQTYTSVVSKVTDSPYKVKLPRSAHWFVVIDLDGKPGAVASSVKVYKTKPANTKPAN